MELSFIAPPELKKLGWGATARWAVEHGLPMVDVEPEMTDQDIVDIRATGLGLGPMRIRASTADSDPETRSEAVERATRELDRAAALGIEVVWTLPRNFRNDASVRANFDAAVGSLRTMAAHAETVGVRIAIENCPFDGQNPICTPEAWDALFDLVPSEAIGICLDPSHCVWQGIDQLQVIAEYADRLLLAQAKDTEMLTDGLFRYGVAGRQLDSAPGSGWWRHRLPGSGAVDWRAYLRALREVGYRGPLTIEHEDPTRSGSPELVQAGLLEAATHLREVSA